MKNIKKEYIPTEEDKQLLIERISQRILESPKEYFHYRNLKMSKEDAIELLNKF